MKSFLTFITLSCFIHFGYSQKNGVTIIEESSPKRIFLYAENNSEIPKVVFLKVDAIGFRRRSDRPLICLLYTSPSPRDRQKSRMPSSA